MDSYNGNGKPVGPIIGLIIVTLVIVVGAIYFAVDRAKKQPTISPNQNTEENLPPNNENATTTQVLDDNHDADVAQIEAELNAITTTDLDADIANVQ